MAAACRSAKQRCSLQASTRIPMTVYDCFMFNNELDILELRLRELDDVVDRFVLVEAAEAHSGIAKPLHYDENKARFARWADRITHIEIGSFPSNLDAWGKENAQRNALSYGLKNIADDDLVIISDVDEIPRASAIREVLTRRDVDVIGLQLTHFNLRLNYMQRDGADPVFVWPVAAWGHAFKRSSPQKLRDFRLILKIKMLKNQLDSNLAVLEHAGWHFSYIGDDEHVRLKLASFAHREFAVSEVLETLGVEAAMHRGMDILGRDGFRWIGVALNEYFPEEIRKNPDRYTSMLLAPCRYEINVKAVPETGLMVLNRIRTEP
ncbi:hypothetical protein [Nisaea sp.]|uniref:hypothetical protein n=1 Tax=Nisaea sp. TaxID=2024842 RepID=UPI002B27C203|nr:hypothetical protein [Nisaea sp.]